MIDPLYNPSLKKSRISVSAEVYGEFNQRKMTKPRIIKKSPNVMKRLTGLISPIFMFSILSEEDKETIVLAMREVSAGPGR
jgi:hypothetical protein